MFCFFFTSQLPVPPKLSPEIPSICLLSLIVTIMLSLLLLLSFKINKYIESGNRFSDAMKTLRRLSGHF